MSVKNIVLTTAEIATKTAISPVPILGSLYSSVIDTVKSECLSKRQKKWAEAVEDRLRNLETTLEDLGQNDQFVTALLKASELAMKTSREEKINFLANSVVNSLNPSVDEEKLLVFLDLLDKYTVSHIKIIYFFYNPRRFEGTDAYLRGYGGVTDPLFYVYPELNNDLFKKIYKDLYVDGMVSLENLNITMTGSGMLAKRTTTIGDEFLKFILDSSDI